MILMVAGTNIHIRQEIQCLPYEGIYFNFYLTIILFTVGQYPKNGSLLMRILGGLGRFVD